MTGNVSPQPPFLDADQPTVLDGKPISHRDRRHGSFWRKVSHKVLDHITDVPAEQDEATASVIDGFTTDVTELSIGEKLLALQPAELRPENQGRNLSPGDLLIGD